MRSSLIGILKHVLLSAAVGGVIGSCSLTVELCAQQAGEGNDLRKENLDLPYNAVGSSRDDEEKAPGVVVLYGQSFEGDGFIFLGEGTT